MREIKFRGMSATGRMRYGRLSQDKPNETAYYKEFSQRICWDDVNNPVRNKTLGQYTGLKDKNGKEIYEGDVVNARKYEHIEPKKLWKLYEVKWGLSGWFLRGYYNLAYKEEFFSVGFNEFDEIEVIGNIYENPELLKKR